MNKDTILGFNICNTTCSEITNCIFKDFDNNISNFIVNINPEIIMNNYKNKNIINLFNMENYQIPDGIGIIYASKIKHGQLKNRITGIDLMNELCRESINHSSKIFLYGSTPGTAEKAKIELEKVIPDIKIVRNLQWFCRRRYCF